MSYYCGIFNVVCLEHVVLRNGRPLINDDMNELVILTKIICLRILLKHFRDVGIFMTNSIVL